MRVSLTPHPQSPRGPVSSIEVTLVRLGPADMRLQFLATGNMSNVALPEFSGTSARRDELWKHTCFEAFVGAGSLAAYHEINLAPSADWAAYSFEGYRAGMSEALIEPWTWERLGDSRSLKLTADIDLRRVDVDKDSAWRLALSAVIEDTDGDKTYWALAHPSDKPDFHHPDSFTLVLPAPESAGTEQP